MNFKTPKMAALLKLYAGFLENLSVASAAVGMFQEQNFALLVAFISIVAASALVCLKEDLK